MENIKTPLYKRKALVIPIVSLMVIALVSAAVVFATSHAIVTVDESLNTTDISITPSGYPGDTISEDITIKSLSTGDIPITISWTGTANVSNVEYTYTGPTADTLETGDNIITLNWTISSGSPTGDFEGDITLTRI